MPRRRSTWERSTGSARTTSGDCSASRSTPAFTTTGGDYGADRFRNVMSRTMLRIESDRGIPPSNTFGGSGTTRCNATGQTAPGLICQEIWAMGLRNPFLFTMDPNAAGTELVINDVGQDKWEEIDKGVVGADYGWPVREGPC